MQRWVWTIFAALVACGSSAVAAPPAPPTNLQVLARLPNSALIRWTPGAGATKAFKIRKSVLQGVHPDATVFPGGKLAAFTWCTDDGYEDNMLYEPVFSSRGLEFTIFVNPSTLETLDTNDKLTWTQVQALHQAGHEIANHTQNHVTLIDDRSIAIRYTGAEACSLAIASSRLRTWVDGTPDLDILLTNPDVAFMSTLSAYIDDLPNYSAANLFAPDTIYATRSQWLDPISGKQIGAGAAAETLTTMRGVHDDGEMIAEILNAQQELENHLLPIDPNYRCRTLAYPNHGHTQWAMSMLNALGYLGARSGPVGVLPFFSTATYQMHFTSTYEVPHSYPRPSNAWSEGTTRSTFLSRIATWKANHEWTVLMAHNEGEVDAQHLEWTIDTIASDPQVWIARFDEVLDYLETFATDVGYPVDGAGNGAAWIHGLNPSINTYAVMTAYNASWQESAWSQEITIPPYESETAAPEPAAANISFVPRAYPNPFDSETQIEFQAAREGRAHAEIWNLSGRRVRMMELGSVQRGMQRFAWDGRDMAGAKAGAGVYWVRIEVEGEASPVGKVTLLR